MGIDEHASASRLRTQRPRTECAKRTLNASPRIVDESSGRSEFTNLRVVA
jgi:hypothetical protein